jgi:hypothetical protein
MTDREIALRKLAIGDIFHARGPEIEEIHGPMSASLICLVTAIDEGTIYARRIHTQDDAQFDRNTGLKWGKARTRIDCVAPLPTEIYQIFLAMDRRYGAAYALIHQGIEVDPRGARWTADERRAHDFLDEHIEANRI